MITFKLDLNNKEKKYYQIYNYVKNGILNNEILSNEKLPSKRILAKDLNVSLNTVVEAYNLLVDEGFIYSIEKKGYFTVNYNITKNNNTTNFNSKTNNSVKYDYDFTTENIDYNLFSLNKWLKLYNNYDNKELLLSKTLNKGDINLRETIAHNLFETKGVSINYENIIIGCGVEYLLSIVINLIDNNNYLVEDPGYYKIPIILKNNNCNIYYQNIDNEGLIINNINKSYNIYTTPAREFPLGISMSLKRKMELINYSKLYNSYIIEDDFDSEYRYLSKGTPLLSLDSSRVIFFKTFSRTISPSFRIAYMVLPDKLLNKYELKYKYYSNTVSTINQLILNEFIKSGAYYRHLNKTRLAYKQKKDIIITKLKEYPLYFDIISSDGLLSILVKLNNIDNTKLKLKLNEYKIKINFVNSYNKTMNNYLIIGYSSIYIEKIENYITLLINVILECKLM